MFKAIGENLKGFFALGWRDLVGRLKLFSHARKIRKLKDDISRLNRKLGLESWEQGFIDTQTFPTAENLQRFDAMTAEKRVAITAIDKEIEELKEQRKALTTHYQEKLKEQMEQRQPVDAELSELLVEIKRMKREIRGAEHEMKTLHQKGMLQEKRLKEFKSSSGENNEFLISEIESEFKLNKQFFRLKKENIELLSTNQKAFEQRVEKVKAVVDHFDSTIEEIKRNQRETFSKQRQEIQSLQGRKYDLEEQIRKIKVDISPVLEKLGAEVTMRRIQSEKLQDHYRKMDRLEERLDILREKRDKRKRDLDSIGFGIKLGFYSLIFAVIAAAIVLVAVLIA